MCGLLFNAVFRLRTRHFLLVIRQIPHQMSQPIHAESLFIMEVYHLTLGRLKASLEASFLFMGILSVCFMYVKLTFF